MALHGTATASRSMALAVFGIVWHRQGLVMFWLGVVPFCRCDSFGCTGANCDQMIGPTILLAHLRVMRQLGTQQTKDIVDHARDHDNEGNRPKK